MNDTTPVGYDDQGNPIQVVTVTATPLVDWPKLLLVIISFLAFVRANAADAILTWTSVTQDTAGKTLSAPAQYRVYKASGGLLATVNTTTFTVANFVESCWFVTAIDVNGFESDKSNVGCKALPPAKPVLTVK